MSDVKLIWVTPNGDHLISYMARVSNPKNQDADGSKLIKYLMKNKHWSPFEMVSMCVEINTTRDIGRQILRHRSLHFQEWSQRYQDVSLLDNVTTKEVRIQDLKNRQNSLPCTDEILQRDWTEAVRYVGTAAQRTYQEMLEKGVAKEVARALLPEGLTPSRLYVSGTARSWIHYFELRCDKATQKEHRDVASAVAEIFSQQFPQTWEAVQEGAV